MSLSKGRNRRAHPTSLNAVIRPLLRSTFSQPDKIETLFAEDEKKVDS